MDTGKQVLFALLVAVRSEDEVRRIPAGSERDSDATSGEVVDHRPVLGNSNRMMERENDATGANLDALCDRRDRCGSDRGVGVKAAEGVEMPLRRPNRGESVRIGKPRSLEEQAIGVSLSEGRSVARKVEKTQIEATAGERRSRDQGGLSAGRVQNDAKAPRERPEKLEHGDVEREARHCKPGTPTTAQTVVHSGEEVQHRRMRHHHTLGTTCGSRGVENVGKAVREGRQAQVVRAL